MMWIVYDRDTMQILHKFYSKKSAKEYIKYDVSNWSSYNSDIDKVDLLRVDEWRTMKILKRET
ncbi:MAG TPA: hypothetical protein VFM18_17715 [Methanosarcina sp.]|nr:hypothetical protein [Methanosarcina sp.]